MERKRLKRNQKKPNLTEMSIKELKQLKAKVNFLIENSDEDVDDYGYQIFYELLTNKLHKMLRATHQPYPVFKKQRTHHKKLVAVVDYLDELLQSIFAKPKKLWYRKIYRLYINLVIGDIQDSPITLALPTVLNYKDRFPAILDDSFPGYLENGLIKVVFQKELK